MTELYCLYYKRRYHEKGKYWLPQACVIFKKDGVRHARWIPQETIEATLLGKKNADNKPEIS